MFLDQFVDGVFECAGLELFLQGDGNHDDLVVRIRLVSCHESLCRGVLGVIRQFQRFALPALGRGRRSRPARKMIRRGKLLEIAAESPASGARFVGTLLI